MEALFRRHLWVVDLIGIGLGGALVGHAFALLIISAWPTAASTPARGRATPRSPPATVSTGTKSVDGIVARNVFCSTCDASGPRPEPTRLPFKLLAIMFAPPPSDARWSIAVVRDDATAMAGPLAVGATLGEATVVAIEDVRVVLDVGHGRLEVLDLLHPAPGVRADRPASATIADGVRRTGLHRYEIQRAVVERLLQGGIAPPWPRVVPQTRDGAPAGFRLFGVRDDSPFHAIGLANGDTLIEVNGRAITTPDSALAAYGTLRAADHISLLIERDGRRIRMDYAIR
jgi:general secretion pathway protein C